MAEIMIDREKQNQLIFLQHPDGRRQTGWVHFASPNLWSVEGSSLSSFSFNGRRHPSSRNFRIGVQEQKPLDQSLRKRRCGWCRLVRSHRCRSYSIHHRAVELAKRLCLYALGLFFVGVGNLWCSRQQRQRQRAYISFLRRRRWRRRRRRRRRKNMPNCTQPSASLSTHHLGKRHLQPATRPWILLESRLRMFQRWDSWRFGNVGGDKLSPPVCTSTIANIPLEEEATVVQPHSFPRSTHWSDTLFSSGVVGYPSGYRNIHDCHGLYPGDSSIVVYLFVSLEEQQQETTTRATSISTSSSPSVFLSFGVGVFLLGICCLAIGRGWDLVFPNGNSESPPGTRRLAPVYRFGIGVCVLDLSIRTTHARHFDGSRRRWPGGGSYTTPTAIVGCVAILL